MALEYSPDNFELIGSSRQGVQHAIETAIARTGQTTRDLEWFEVKAIRGHIQDGKIGWYQVKLGVGFGALDATNVSKG